MFKKRIIPLLIIMALVISMSACNLVEVNPQKDMERVIFKTNNGKVLKKEFINYLTYYEIMYEINGYQMPTDEQLTAFKEELLNDLVEINIMKQEAVSKGYEIESSTATENFDLSVSQMMASFQDEGKYIAFIEERNLTREEFEDFLKKYLEDIEYANEYIGKYQEGLKASGEEAKELALTVEKEKLLKDEFYYKLFLMEMYYYAYYNQALPSDEASLTTIYGQIQDDMAQSYLIRKDAKTKDIKLKEEDIKKRQEEIKEQFTSLVGQEQLEDYLGGYYLSKERFEELTRLDAEANLYEEAVKADIEKDVKVTEEEIKQHYESNRASYDTSTVSAKHILTESEDLANEIKSEITDGKSFEAAFEKYKDNEQVKEAADLGAFKYSEMVTEFSVAAFALDVGEVSQPVQSEHGYHIIYVYDKNILPVPTLEEKTEEIRETLLGQKVTSKYDDYKTELKKGVTIKKEEIADPFKTMIEDLKSKYKVKTYPKRLG